MVEWRQLVPDLADLSEEVSAILDAQARVMRFAQGARLVGQGQPSDTLYLPVSGSIRIQQMSGTEPATVLCRLRAGDSPALAMACQTQFGPLGVEAVVDRDTEVLLVPRGAFDAIMSRSTEFRAFVFDACAKRIIGLLDMIEDSVLAQFAARTPDSTYSKPTYGEENHNEHERWID